MTRVITCTEAKPLYQNKTNCVALFNGEWVAQASKEPSFYVGRPVYMVPQIDIRSGSIRTWAIPDHLGYLLFLVFQDMDRLGIGKLMEISRKNSWDYVLELVESADPSRPPKGLTKDRWASVCEQLRAQGLGGTLETPEKPPTEKEVSQTELDTIAALSTLGFTKTEAKTRVARVLQELHATGNSINQFEPSDLIHRALRL